MLLDLFKKRGGILLASGMAEGVDLPDDLARFCVIVKIPYPSFQG